MRNFQSVYLFINQLQTLQMNMDQARPCCLRSSVRSSHSSSHVCRYSLALHEQLLAALLPFHLHGQEWDFVCTILITVYMQIKHRVLHEFLCSAVQRVTRHRQLIGYISGSTVDIAAFQLAFCVHLVSNIIIKTWQPVFFLTVQLFALCNLIAIDNLLIISYHG